MSSFQPSDPASPPSSTQPTDPSPTPGPDRPPTYGSPEPVWYGTTGPAPMYPVRTERPRTPVYIALFVVAVLAGSALFVSGFTLGAQQAVTPGTSDANQARFQPFWEAYNKVTAEYVGELDHKALVEGAIKGMFQAIGDPYSAYMTSQEYKDSLAGISGQFEGIGAVMTSREGTEEGCAPLSETCRLVVQRVLDGAPAQKAGLKADDEVIAVDGAAVVGSTLEDTVSKVRGPRGTKVKLSLLRDGKPLELEIERDVIETESVRSEILADGRVGYLRIDGFSSSAAGDFKEHLGRLVDADVSGLVLDLRDDPGGFVDAALTIASQFMATGPVYWEEKADGSRKPLDPEPGGLATDPALELVVLVNGGSASASEIVAGALQDSGRAKLVGEQTFGKGTIQQWNLLSNDSGGFRLSIAKWLTPDQTWIHGTGLTPDVVVSRPDGTPTEQDPQLDRAIEVLTDGAEAGVLPLAA